MCKYVGTAPELRERQLGHECVNARALNERMSLYLSLSLSLSLYIYIYIYI